MSPAVKDQAQADFATLFLHGQNQAAAIDRAATAKAWGFEPTEWASPFTQSKVETHNHFHEPPPPPPPPQSQAGNFAKLLLSAGLLATGAGLPIAGYQIASALLKPAVEKVLTRDADVQAGDPIVEQPQE